MKSINDKIEQILLEKNFKYDRPNCYFHKKRKNYTMYIMHWLKFHESQSEYYTIRFLDNNEYDLTDFNKNVKLLGDINMLPEQLLNFINFI